MRHSFDIHLIERHHKAREAVMRDAGLMPAGVDPAIVRGWQRCLSMGLEPERPVLFQPLSRSLSRWVIEANTKLKSLAEQEVHLLARALSSQGAIVILADASLSVMHADGVQATSANELKLISRVGVDTSERSIGSNALSIAAAELSPVTVLQNAHFCSSNAIFSCAGAPIRTPTGQLAGILDVTTAYRPLPTEALFLTAAAARAIENSMFQPRPGEVLIRCHPRAEFVGTPMAALLMISDEGELCGANEAAINLFKLRWPLRQVNLGQILQTPLGQILHSVGKGRTGQLQLTSMNGVPLAASVQMASANTSTPDLGGTALGEPQEAGEMPLELAQQPDLAVSAATDTGSLRAMERAAIDRALAHYQGNITAAARSLGVSRATLYRRIRETK